MRDAHVFRASNDESLIRVREHPHHVWTPDQGTLQFDEPTDPIHGNLKEDLDIVHKAYVEEDENKPVENILDLTKLSFQPMPSNDLQKFKKEVERTIAVGKNGTPEGWEEERDSFKFMWNTHGTWKRGRNKTYLVIKLYSQKCDHRHSKERHTDGLGTVYERVNGECVTPATTRCKDGPGYSLAQNVLDHSTTRPAIGEGRLYRIYDNNGTRCTKEVRLRKPRMRPGEWVEALNASLEKNN